jgi:hypothetical protein
MTVCKHGIPQIECLECLEENMEKEIGLLTREREAKAKCYKRYFERKKALKLEK